MSEQSLGDFVFHIGANTDDFQRKTGAAISSLRGGLQSLLSSVIAPLTAALSAKTFVQNMTADLSRLNELSKNLGVSAESISTWENAFAEAGAGVNKVGELFMALNSGMQTAMTRGAGAMQRLVDKGLIPAYTDLGGEMKNVEDYAVELSDTLASMDSAQAAGIMRQLGFSDADTIDFMRRGSDAIREQLAAAQGLGVATAEDVKKAKDFEATLGRLSHSIKRALLPVFSAIIPIINAAASVMALIAQHSAVLIPLVAALAAKLVTVLIPALAKVGAALAANPLTWIIAGLIALGLLLEDFVVWLDGGKSAFGDFYESIFGDAKDLKKTFENIGDWFKAMASKLKTVASALGVSLVGALFGPIGAAIGFVIGLIWTIYDNWDEVVEDCSMAWEWFCNLVKTLWNGACDFLKGVWDEFCNLFSGVLASIGEKWNTFTDTLSSAWTACINALRSAWDSFTSSLSSGINWLENKITGMVDKISDAWRKAKEFFGFEDDEKNPVPSAGGNQKDRAEIEQELYDRYPTLKVDFPDKIPDYVINSILRDKAAAEVLVPPAQVVAAESGAKTQNNEMHTTININGSASPADYEQARETANGINADIVDALNGSQFGAK